MVAVAAVKVADPPLHNEIGPPGSMVAVGNGINVTTVGAELAEHRRSRVSSAVLGIFDGPAIYNGAPMPMRERIIYPRAMDSIQTPAPTPRSPR